MIRPFKLILAASFASLSLSAAAQTKLDRQLSYVDLGVQAVGQLTGTVTGPVTIPAFNEGGTVSQFASNTVGALVTIRYSPKPYLGAEFNGSYARFTENYTAAPGQIQTQANEFTFGYLVTPPYAIFGLKPYASAGVGLMRFAPTAGGGQNAPSEGRPAFYGNIGVQKDLFGSRYGVRVGYRQVIYIAPDFYQNYLTINKYTSTKEPLFGFYARF